MDPKRRGVSTVKTPLALSHAALAVAVVLYLPGVDLAPTMNALQVAIRYQTLCQNAQVVLLVKSRSSNNNECSRRS